MRLEFTDIVDPRMPRQRGEQEERDHYAEMHDRYRLAMDAALATIRRAEFIRNRPPAARYILAEYKWPYK